MCITQVQIYDYTHSCGHKLGPNTRQSIAPCPIALARRENSSDQGYSCYHCPEVIYTYPVDPCESCKQHGHWVWDFDVYDFVQVAAGVLGEESSAKAGDAEMDVECSSWNTMPQSMDIPLLPGQSVSFPTAEPSCTTAVSPRSDSSNITMSARSHVPLPVSPPPREHEDILVAAMSGVHISAVLPRGGSLAATRTIALRRREAKRRTRTLTVFARAAEDMGVLRRRTAVKKRTKS